MPKLSQTVRGKAFEYACLFAIADALKEQGLPYTIEEDKAFITAQTSFELLEHADQEKYKLAAKTALKIILPLEPRIADASTKGSATDSLNLVISSDSKAKGAKGDVRDVVCIRSTQGWEVGFSCKHNHEALKHPRLTQKRSKKDGSGFSIADFGTDWVGYPCSEEYFEKMSACMESISKHVGESWTDAYGSGDEKYDVVYVPILECIIEEIIRLCHEHHDVPEKLLAYFFGSEDFYKIISLEPSRQTKVVAFNMYNTLNAASKEKKPINKIPKLNMPSRLIEARFKEKTTGEISKTTLTLVFDHGWTINMRLHSADTLVKLTGLKFDVSLEGNPHGIYQQQRSWFE